MGDQSINYLTEKDKQDFLRYLLNDILALETMIKEGKIESGVTRIGAEQEFCLVDEGFRPTMTGPEILESISEEHFTSELAKWNLEINLDPQDMNAGCFSRMHKQLDEMLALARKHSEKYASKIALTGILPTIRQSDLDFSNMTPNPRYRVLDQSMKNQRGEDFNLNIEGVDELSLKHDSILFEACNTSFQIHLQISPEEFADRYNWSQLIAGPVLACCVNSPILLGKELWSETRIALFRQSIDIRNAGNYIREQQPRVAFGHKWLDHSAAEIFKDDISFYNLIVSGEVEEDSMAMLERGEYPKLRAMNLHNGTIYKWNRACYGVGGGVPHLRIENRYVPSGPTTLDEMAATVFWTGLMLDMPDNMRGAWEKKIHFQEVRSNFLKAARNGMSNEFYWGGRSVNASNLINDILLPMAEEGLHRQGVSEEEYLPYLNVIQKRVSKRQNGSEWIINSLRALRRKHSKDESLLMLTKSMEEQSRSGAPVHEWDLLDDKTTIQVLHRFDRVDSLMSVDLITVEEEDLLIFAEQLMEWHNYSNLPVENSRGHVIGVVNRKELKKLKESDENYSASSVKSCMKHDIITIRPESPVSMAKEAFEVNKIGCIPVVKEGTLVGIISKSDIRRSEETA